MFGLGAAAGVGTRLGLGRIDDGGRVSGEAGVILVLRLGFWLAFVFVLALGLGVWLGVWVVLGLRLG